MARLAPARREDFPESLLYVWDRLAERGSMPNIYRFMGNNPQLLRGYTRMGNALWGSAGLDVPTRELAILRVAILLHSPYEWHAHVRIGRAAGLGDERIRALHTWQSSELFTPAERAMLAYLDAVVASDHPTIEAHRALEEHFPASAVVGINLLAGFYAMTAKFLGAMEVETEEAFVGWEPGTPA